jgi:eukaryotic-like serine/threonine-protein kinase
MIPSSPFFCNACGAANQPQAKLCWACNQPLDASAEDSTATSAAFLSQRYRVVGMVGQGGYGAVYKAEDVQRHNALVAIKSINLSHLSSREIIEATDTFNREMLLLSDLQHPNLPHIHDHFTDREHWYLVMDFIAGETLETYVNRAKGGHLAVGEVLEIGMRLCEVLGYLHSQQPPIIFRDVKPANLMRTPTGHLYLIDFGIARRFRPGQKHDTTVLGSPGYAPPEQYGTAQTTVQSDIYSLSATLRYLLTGKDPAEPTFGYASLYPKDIPAELELLLTQMLELDASKRPASMEVVKRDLQQIQNERLLVHSRQPVRASQQTAPPAWTAGGQILHPPATRAARRGISRRTVLIGLVGLATIGGGLAVSMLSQQNPLPAPTQGAQSPSPAPTQGAQSPQVTSVSQPVYTYTGHSDIVEAVAWSRDGKRIASGSVDQTVQVWDAATGRNVLTYGGHSSPVYALVWSPDGRYIASGSYDKTVQVWGAP